MGTNSETIPDLENGLSGFKEVFDKISEQMDFDPANGALKGIIQIGILIIQLSKWNYSFLKGIFSVTG